MPLPVISMSPAVAIRWLWILFWFYWFISAFGAKKTKRSESWLSRLSYTLPFLAAAFLMIRPELRHRWGQARFLPAHATTEWAATALTFAGMALAVWARRKLGRNWSGTVTLKEGHELIRSGPYRWIRHPIYTGILLAVLGTALEIGKITGLIAFAILWASFWAKAQREESFLREEFGDRFELHRQQTGMFLPKFARENQSSIP